MTTDGSAAGWQHPESSLPCVISGLCTIESHTWIAPCAKAVIEPRSDGSAATPDFDIVHIKQADGRCVISIDGQGHLPCGEHSAATPPTVEWAVEVVARMAIFGALDNIEWGDYPEVGEHDWQQVLDRIAVIGCGLKPLHDDYIEAYAVLESRAEKEAEGV